jgi:hypothetical protein
MSVVPLAVLSMVKHQEARFLLPLLPCIVLMCAHKLRFINFSQIILTVLKMTFIILTAGISKFLI